MITELNDNSIMPYGRHKGEKLINVPDGYLKWLYNEINSKSKIHWTLNDKLLHNYIKDNL